MHSRLIILTILTVSFFSCRSSRFTKEQELYRALYKGDEVKKEVSDEKLTTKSETPTVVNLPTDSLDIIYPSVRKNTYRIACIMPFLLDGVFSEDYSQDILSRTAQDFFMGVNMAAEDAPGDTKFIFDFYDDKASETGVREIIEKNLKSNPPDLIFGPFVPDNLKLVNNFSLEHKIPLISLLSNEDSFLIQNPYYCYAQPTNEMFIAHLCRYLRNNFNKPNFILIGGTDAENKINRNFLLKYIDSSYFSGLHSIKVNEYNWGSASYRAYLQDTGNILLITSENPVVVNSIVNTLVTKEKKMTFFVPQKWLTMPTVDLNFLSTLDMNFFSGYFIDYSDSNNKQFIKRFRNKYNAEPGILAFQGYQLSLMAMNMLKNYGVYFFKDAFLKPDAPYREDFVRLAGKQGFEMRKVALLHFVDLELKEIK